MKSDKIKLALLLFITVLPLGLATWMFQRYEQQGGLGTTNKGELILPPLDITALGMRGAEGEALFRSFEEEVAGIPPEDYRPRPWMLVYLGGPACGRDCEERLYYLRQVHRRLSAEAPRVRRWYLSVVDEGAQAGLEEATRELFAREFPDMGIAYGDAAVLRGNLAGTHEPGQDPIGSHYIYVVDPVGNVMLYFTPDNTPEQILDDIDKLLERSSLG